MHNIAELVGYLLLPISFYFIYARFLKREQKHPYPPGPSPKPLVGNLFDLPNSKSDAAATYMEWGVKYNSKILHASCFGTHAIILNSLKDAEALLETKAAIYSDRPDIPTIDMISWSRNVAFMRHGQTWQKHRRLSQQNFRPEAAAEYNPTQLRHVHIMLKNLLDTPERFEDHSQTVAVGVGMYTMYGYDLDEDDPYVKKTKEASIAAFKLMQPTFTIINLLPILKHIPAWLPFATSQKMIRDTKQLTETLIASPIEVVKKNIKLGQAAPSMVSRVLEGSNVSEEDEHNVSGLAFAIYTAGSDTVISSILTFIYLMVKHPNVQRKAQEEIDRVIGVDRLPNFDDRNTLPYIEAIYREVLRWKPPGPIAVPHGASQDDVYKGYYIPKGATIVANVWAMTRDESLYPEAASFKPERFIRPDGTLTDDDRVLAYGFGRRLCAGKHVASATLWLTIVSILAAFKIEQAKDKNGQDIEVNDEYDNASIVVRKKPFKCSFTPRFSTSRSIIQETVLSESLNPA